jgi:hypothetical protein
VHLYFFFFREIVPLRKTPLSTTDTRTVYNLRWGTRLCRPPNPFSMVIITTTPRSQHLFAVTYPLIFLLLFLSVFNSIWKTPKCKKTRTVDFQKFRPRLLRAPLVLPPQGHRQNANAASTSAPKRIKLSTSPARKPPLAPPLLFPNEIYGSSSLFVASYPPINGATRPLHRLLQYY